MGGTECRGQGYASVSSTGVLTDGVLRTVAARATARATNLLVILFGAGFSAMLVYALTSELFSKNSPTVLHAQACELIKSSPKVRA